MSYGLTLVFAFSIAIAAVIGWIRFKQIDPVYQPFLILISLAFFNEVLSVILAYAIRNNIVNNNLYLLCESLLITWQFKRWKLFARRPYLYPAIISLFLLGWLTEVGIFGVKAFCSYFIIFYSFVIVLLSISMINLLVVKEHRFLLKHPTFLICSAFIAYFTFAALNEAFWQYGLNENSDFRLRIYHLLHFISLFSNLIYALAVLWMPTRLRFILPSSSPVS